jgi:hypothetical protein
MQRPVFILGNIGSGTTVLHATLLQAIDGAVDIDSTDQESRPFWKRHGLECGSPLTGTNCRAPGADGAGEAQEEKIRAAFRRMQKRGHTVITKNPHFCNKVPFLHRLFPDALFLHIVRQDLSVIATMKKKFLAFDRGQTPWQVRCVHYWPDEERPCWAVVPREQPNPWQIFREQARRVLRKGGLTSPPAFAGWKEFRAAHPDGSRYFPGAGFHRLEEAWIKSNHNILADIQRLGLQSDYLALNYQALVEQPRSTFEHVAEFLGIDYRAGFRFDTLRPDRQDKWRRDLSSEEVAMCVEKRQYFGAAVEQLVAELPGPLLVEPNGNLAMASGKGTG